MPLRQQRSMASSLDAMTRVVSDETRKKLSESRKRTETMKKQNKPLMGYELRSNLWREQMQREWAAEQKSVGGAA